jgi:hypothetical protein
LEGRRIFPKGEYSSLGSPREIASEIGPYTDLQLLRVVILAYKMLYDERIVDRSWPEDKITRELCVRIAVHTQKNSVNAIPLHQYPIFPKTMKRGKPPTVDFVFRRGYEESSYLAFECKIVDDAKDRSIQEYIGQGLMRFLSGKYARDEKIAGMIAYLINSEITSCVLKINEQIKQNVGDSNCLVKSSVVFDYDGVYQSNHKKPPVNTLFLIYHIFMTFNTRAELHN